MKHVKITRNVIHQCKILQKDETHQVTDDHADLLVKGGHAKEIAAPAPAAPPAPEGETGNGGKKSRGKKKTGDDAPTTEGDAGNGEESPADGDQSGK